MATIPTAIGPANELQTRIGKLDFELGLPTEATAAKLYDEMDLRAPCSATCGD
jgi:hypothetical protein